MGSETTIIMVILDFDLHGLHWAVRNEKGEKFSELKYMSQAAFEPTPGTPWQVNQRSRQLGHDSRQWTVF